MTDTKEPDYIYLQPECCADPEVRGEEWVMKERRCKHHKPWIKYVRAGHVLKYLENKAAIDKQAKAMDKWGCD